MVATEAHRKELEAMVTEQTVQANALLRLANSYYGNWQDRQDLKLAAERVRAATQYIRDVLELQRG